MIPCIEYQALCDFAELETIRRTCASGSNGIRINNIPAQSFGNLIPLGNQSLGFSGLKANFASPQSLMETTVQSIMKAFHEISRELFKNLSHALELPWEKYLEEMHEFSAPSEDKLRILQVADAIPNEWSSLTIILNTASPQSVIVTYGDSLSVFSEGKTPVLCGSTIQPVHLLENPKSMSGYWVVYYVRPNEDVFYTRAAGALMTPLNSEEYESRKRVRDMGIVS